MFNYKIRQKKIDFFKITNPNPALKAGACFIGFKKSKKFFSYKSTANIFNNMPTKF